MRPQLHSLFPTPIFQSEIPLEDLWLEYVKSLMYDRTVGDTNYISRDRNIFEQPELKDLKDKIEEQIRFYAYEYLKVQRYVDIEVVRSWGVYHRPSDWAAKHCHSNSIFSGIYYLEVDEYSGDLLIDKGQHASNCFIPTLTPDVTHFNQFTQQNWRLKPEKGMLVAFPSQVIHEVEANRSVIDRYCVAFDVFIRGRFGDMAGSDVTIK